MSAQVHIPHCIISSFDEYTSPKSGRTYHNIKIQSVSSTGRDSLLELSSTDVDLSKLPRLVPVQVTMELRGFIYGNRQRLEIVGITCKPSANGTAASN